MSDFTEFEIVDDGVAYSPPTPAAKTYRDAPYRPVASSRDRRERRDYGRDQPMQVNPISAGREIPSSAEAEEYLLSCCFLDGRDTVGKAMASGVTERTFYHPGNPVIWRTLGELYSRKCPIDMQVLAEELKATRQLVAAGNYARLVEISQKVPTTAQTDYFILKLREAQCLRDFIERATQAVENAYNFTGDMGEVLAPLKNIADVVEVSGTSLAQIARPLCSFTYPVNDPSRLIGTKYRYLGRGGSLLIPAPAGIGKSTASYQMAYLWGIGRDFLGLDCIHPLRVLIIQCEDDEGDVGEVVESIRQGLNLTKADMDLVNRNVAVIRDRQNIGDAFFPMLQNYARHHKPDLVIINPLMRYCPGLSKEEIAGPFLSRLDGIADEYQFGIVAFHHTPKPPTEQPGKGKPAKRDAVDRQYTAFGSSALTNWARAIINIAKVRNEDGVFIFQFDKRGGRAGVTKEVAQGMASQRVATRELRIQHSGRRININGQDMPMILWEVCADQNPPEPEDDEDDKPKGGKSRAKFTPEEMASIFPLGRTAAVTVLQCQRRAMETLGMSKAQFNDLRFNLVTEGTIERDPEGKYYRPSVDDRQRKSK